MKISNITKITNRSNRYDIQTGTENFFANGVLVHNSMIHTVQTDQGVRLKSKKTFDSDVAKAAQRWMDERPMVQQMVDNMAAQNCTAIFEWTAPDARIVLFYPEAELRLLHVRNNETGEYMDAEVMRAYAAQFGVKCVDEVEEFFWTMESDGLPSSREFDVQKMLDAAETREGVEGWIVQFANGDMVKVKTKWYLRLHHSVTFMTERDIAELVIDEKIDDFKSILSFNNFSLDKVNEIERRVVSRLNQIRRELDECLNLAKKMSSRKEIALSFMEHKLFSLIMAAVSNKEPNIPVFFKKHYLNDEFSRNQI